MIKRFEQFVNNPNFLLALIWSAIFLALMMVRNEPYWYDEAFTALLSRLPLADLLRATANDVHPPLHYLIVALTGKIIPGELGSRFWSCICQVAAMGVLLRLLGLLKVDRKLYFPILALVAFMPVELIYTSEGRMYAQLQLLVLLQVMAVLERRWWLLGIATTLGLYTHNYAAIYSLVIGLAAILIELRSTCFHVLPPKFSHLSFVDFNPPASQFRQIALALGIPIVLWLPWVVYGVIPQALLSRSGHHWIQPVNIGQALFTFFRILQSQEYPKLLVVTLAMLVAFGMILTIRSAWRAKQRLILALALAPWIIASLASLITPLLLYRGFLPSIPFVVVLIVTAIQRASRWGRVVGISMVTLSVGISLVSLLVNGVGLRNGSSIDGLTDIPPGSLVVHLDDTSIINSLPYPKPGVRNVLLSACPESIGALGPVVYDAIHIEVIHLADLPDHYYLVGSISPLSTACNQILLNDLRSGAQTIVEYNAILGTRGIYYVDHR